MGPHMYPKCRNVFSDFDQNEAKFRIRYHKYMVLDGYPASLGFPIMHQVHAICTQSI